MFINLRRSLTLAGFVSMAAVPAFGHSLPLPPLPRLPGLTVRVNRPDPPRLRWESKPRCPGQGYVWVGGFWDWQDERWGWIDGRWEAPGYSGDRDHWRDGRSHRSRRSHQMGFDDDESEHSSRDRCRDHGRHNDRSHGWNDGRDRGWRHHEGRGWNRDRRDGRVYRQRDRGHRRD